MSDDADKPNDEQPPTLKSAGGQGEILDPHHGRGHARMIEMAINNGFPIYDRMHLAVNAATELSCSSNSRKKARGAALFVSMDRNNIARARLAQTSDATQEGYQPTNRQPAARGNSGEIGSPIVNVQVNVPVVFVDDWYGKRQEPDTGGERAA